VLQNGHLILGSAWPLDTNRDPQIAGPAKRNERDSERERQIEFVLLYTNEKKRKETGLRFPALVCSRDGYKNKKCARSSPSFF
jgi:hypothetical protein